MCGPGRRNDYRREAIRNLDLAIANLEGQIQGMKNAREMVAGQEKISVDEVVALLAGEMEKNENDDHFAAKPEETP